mgnify:CR=1 FL=1
MLIALHKQARTTPHVRAQIAASDEPVAVLARRYGVTEPTIYKWKRRADVYARPHTAPRLQTTLTPGQEAIGVYLRRALWLPLDALLACEGLAGGLAERVVSARSTTPFTNWSDLMRRVRGIVRAWRVVCRNRAPPSTACPTPAHQPGPRWPDPPAAARPRWPPWPPPWGPPWP